MMKSASLFVLFFLLSSGVYHSHSDKPVAEDLCFPIPDMPKDWTPNPKHVWEREKANSKDEEVVVIPPSQSSGGLESGTWCVSIIHMPGVAT
ncbi:hypothetical protein DEU56DRAFT_128704 [Suillus clintonianus]|uniref:uncharacterized protein n=1 Tax=Suillus clintonianus TaxID=1904413 RepID=UPI001B8657AA|nr:uncharacterized protein DEU56DRAFT_128704 [Suillus clintonianus]KAG2147572.1 hypothetical protein DEU56DRAFT_128704 [Suillus clintonianus]